MVADTKALLEIDDDKKRYEVSLSVFGDMRRDVTKLVRETIQEKKYKITEIANDIGVDVGGISRRTRNDNTMFSLPNNSLVKFSRKYMTRSCHELFFGEKGITMLPKPLSVLVEYLSESSDANKERILTFTEQEYSAAAAMDELLTDVKASDLMRERLLEQIRDRHINPAYLFGKSAPAALKYSIRRYMDPEVDQSGNLSNIMYYTMCLGTSFDYFLAVDYTPYVGFKLFGADDSEVIKDKKIRRFVSKYLLLPKSRKSAVFRFIVNIHWLENTPNTKLPVEQEVLPAPDPRETEEHFAKIRDKISALMMERRTSPTSAVKKKSE